MIGRKIIFILLGLMLISGAIFAGVTIGSGKGLFSNSDINQPQTETLQQNVVLPATGAGLEVEAVDQQSQEYGSGCHHDSALNPADW